MNALPLFPVTVVGSLPRSDDMLKALRNKQKGSITKEEFNVIADKAVLEALRLQEEAGVEIVSDGEQRRDSFFSFIAEHIEGARLMSLAEMLDFVEDKAAFERLLSALDVPAFALKNPVAIGNLKRRSPLALNDYPPFILASTAAAVGYEVQVFFTFYGLQLLHKDLSNVMISPLANPAMPMPVIVQMLPGMESMATMMMKAKLKKHGVASLQELRDLCLEAEVKFIACQMAIDLFEFDKSEFIDNVEYGGAATFMEFAGETDICLFI